eukprot:350270-Chlamydomonas_euryale.AAC.2
MGPIEAQLRRATHIYTSTPPHRTPAEERLESERAARSEASARLSNAEAQLRAAHDKAAAAASAAAEASSREHTAAARAAALEDARADLAAKVRGQSVGHGCVGGTSGRPRVQPGVWGVGMLFFVSGCVDSVDTSGLQSPVLSARTICA